MIKAYRIILILTTFVFISTYSPNELSFSPTKKNIFFKIKKIEVVNTDLIDKNNIIERLTNIYDKNILTINRQDIERPLQGISFLNKVEVKKKYPDTIIIKIYETKPLAILFKDKKKYLFDTSANLILFKENMNFSNLPNIFGEGAENDFLNFFTQLEDKSFPKNKIKNFYYHKIGRWDLELLNNKIIKLPNEKILDAIQKSIELLNRKDFEKYNIIDLRIRGKIVVE